MCNAEIETQQHFLTCTDARSRQAWIKALDAIRQKAHKLALDPTLSRLITHAIDKWRHQNTFPIPAFLPQSYHKLFQQQSNIGWNQIIKGRLTPLWAHHQDLFAPNHQGVNKFSILITTIYSEVYTIWKERCDVQHGKTQTDIDNKTKYQIEPRIQALYATKPRLTQLDQLLFDTPIENIMALPVNQLEHWLKRTTTIVKASLKRARNQDRLQMKPLQYYFPTRTQPPPPTLADLSPVRPNLANTPCSNPSIKIQAKQPPENLTTTIHTTFHQQLQRHPSVYKPP
jgi:hypothetical protein